MKKVIISTGGTGGHIYPALALASAIEKKEKDCEIVFFGSSNRMEAELIPAKGYRFVGRDMTGTNGGIRQKIKSLHSLLTAERYCIQFLKEEKPDICVGFGNYISVPLMMAAHRLHIPTMISEQNSSAGKANKMLAKYVDAIELSYASSGEGMPAGKVRVLGNPEATACLEAMNEEQDYDLFDLDKTIPFVVFMMGSLGSSSVSKVIDEACQYFDDSYQVLIAKGKSNDYVWKSEKDNIRIVEYVDGKAMLKHCDLAICRAGATTLCEISALGAASILIPSPYVPNNHQYYNALELVNADAACMIEEKDLNAESLSNMVNALMKNPAKREMMKVNAKKLGTEDCAYQMVDWMKEIIR